MPLPSSLLGKTWSHKTAQDILPILVWCAQNGRPISYGQLDAEVQRRRLGHHVNVVVYGHPAGMIGNAILETEAETGERIPPLNSIIVNAATGIPGSGCDYYLKHYLGRVGRKELTDEQRRSMAEEAMAEVWRYEGWGDLLARYGLRPLRGAVPALVRAKRSRVTPKKGGWSSEPESEEHRLLKHWVAENPQTLRTRIAYGKGSVEWLFASADRADVVFEHKDGCLAVEVKSRCSNAADLERGIYQCVKYEALLRAELKSQGRIPNGRSLLVTERPLPQRLRELADLLGVRVLQVPATRA